MNASTHEFRDFAEFYPYYLREHSNRTCRRLHFAGTTLVLLLTAAAVVGGRWSLLWWVPVAGYGFAWLGHFAFEKNRPATFRHPLYSLRGDFEERLRRRRGRYGPGKFRSHTGRSRGIPSARCATACSFGHSASNQSRRGCQRVIAAT
jgi:hypothetical protein